jgi:hypothetical protein
MENTFEQQIDEILFGLTDWSAWDIVGVTQAQVDDLSQQLLDDRAEAKQAIIQAVLDVLPDKVQPREDPYTDGWNDAIDQTQSAIKLIGEK